MTEISIKSIPARALSGVLVLLLLLFATGSLAQSTIENQPIANLLAKPAAEIVPNYEYPRTLRDRFRDYGTTTFSPWSLFTPSVTAGLSQWRNYPREWKQGGEGFGKRLASGYADNVVENTFTFGLSALDQEDLRYPLSAYPKTAILKRLGHAISYTIVPKKEGGGRRFGWSRLAGDYGAGFVANTWYPARHSDMANALYLGSANLGGDLAINILKEFIRPHFVWGNNHNERANKKNDQQEGR